MTTKARVDALLDSALQMQRLAHGQLSAVQRLIRDLSTLRPAPKRHRHRWAKVSTGEGLIDRCSICGEERA